MGLIRKSNGMTNTSGGVAYNIVNKTQATGIVVKGMNGVNIYNNTLYSYQPFYGGPDVGASGFVTAINNGAVTVRATANDGSGIYGSIVIPIFVGFRAHLINCHKG